MYSSVFPKKITLIGMIHLLPMPGYPNHSGMESVIRKALQDLRTLEEAGFDGALVENDNDQPHRIGVTEEVSEAFRLTMVELLSQAKIPVGMEIIYDAEKTIKVAHEVGAPFIRLDVFVDTVETKWGIISANAEELVKLKHSLKANDLLIFSDIQVKHAKMLQVKPLEKSAKDAIKYGSDALIVTGDWTGQPPTEKDCMDTKRVSKNTPVLIGSGFSAENAIKLLSLVDGAIVGTSIKTDGNVDLKKAKKLVSVVSSI